MATYYPSTLAFTQYSDSTTGAPLSGGTIEAYLAGTTTPVAMYKDDVGTSVGSVVTLNSGGYPAASGAVIIIWLVYGVSYKFVLKNSAGSTIATADTLGFDVPLTTVSTYSDLLALSPSNYSAGDSVIVSDTNYGGLFTVTSGTTADNGGTIKNNATWTAASKYFKRVMWTLASVKWFGAIGDGLTDDTSAIQSAINYAAANGVSIYIPAGTYLITTVSKNNTGSDVPFSIVGDGQRSSILKKTGTSTDPVLALSTNSSVLETYHKLSGFSIRGNAGASAHNGLNLSNYARFRIEQVEVRDCNIGLNLLGVLVGEFDNVLIKDNTTGVYVRKNGSIYSNALTFNRCVIIGNTSFGMDLGQGNGINITDSDLESNGTAANTATGAMILRSNLNDEVGFSIVSITGCHFESNNGWTLKTENSSSAAKIFIRDTSVLASESGQVAYFDYAGLVHIEGLVAASPSDAITVSANVSTFICSSSTISTITNSCANYSYSAVSTSGGLTLFQTSRSGVSSLLESSGVASIGSQSAVGGGKLGVAFDGSSYNGICVKNTSAGSIYAMEVRNSANASVGYIISGTGAPAMDAPISSLYLRQDGGATTSLYVKTASGAGAGNWTAK